jgi:hypothetical protein
MVLQQATIAAYADVFLLMFYISLPILLLIVFLRKMQLLPNPAPANEMEALE